MATDVRRKVPSVDALLRSEPARRATVALGRSVLKRTLTTVLDEVREAAARGTAPPPDEALLVEALHRASRAIGGLTPVINATGVILHTNLGRAPLPRAAASAAARSAMAYSDLEVDRDTGKRGARGARAELILASLTDAQDALVVNNCAAALLLALSALAKGKPVLVSRGELIEIGGEFRIPDIMSASGAKLVEVGTTNRTRIGDYRTAASDRTGAILRVHPSNYRVVGFTATPATKDLAALARKLGVPFIFDVGSGLLRGGRGPADEEPTVGDALADGADLVTFSGDKLMGGPQAGCIVGRSDLVARLRKHPLARAVRVDKMQVAALERVLALHATGRSDEIPVHRMVHETASSVRGRAQQVVEAIGGDLEGAHLTRCASVIGGGSMPGRELPSWAVAMSVPDPVAFAARLRNGSPSVFGRVEDGRVVLDVRTVLPEQVADLARAVQYALEGDDLDDEA
jgi:L-seryl-tRNA(Ser) seleniumtransferase